MPISSEAYLLPDTTLQPVERARLAGKRKPRWDVFAGVQAGVLEYQCLLVAATAISSPSHCKNWVSKSELAGSFGGASRGFRLIVQGGLLVLRPWALRIGAGQRWSGDWG
ncbi:hypothetical protein ACT691_16575 [Vibrio metschnikovii]